jgi:integrase
MRLLLRAVTSWKPLGVRKANAPISQNPEDYRHRTDDVLANLVICGFAGLRQSEFERMTWEMVKLDRSKIDLPPEITKTKKRKLVTIRPVLREWLLRYFRGKTGPIMQTNFCNRLKAFKRYLKREHHLAWLHNGMRHSFASHLLEETQDPGHVALELGHRGGVGVLWDHYAERVGKEDAADYWKSTPEAVAEVAGGLVPFEAKAGAA